MATNEIILTLFMIFIGASLLSTVALFTRQSLLVAYMLLGIILGPWGLGAWGLSPVGDHEAVQKVGEVGIVFLMFLLGLHLQPQNLYHMLKKTLWVSMISSVVFLGIGYGVGVAFGYSFIESIIIGLSMMFSSTIIGLKLLPTTVLHHQHTGEVMISVLLMQDLIAILVLLLIHGASVGALQWQDLMMTGLALPALILFAFLVEHIVLMRLLARFDRVREYMFLLSIAWCLGLAELANLMGLSYEVGALLLVFQLHLILFLCISPKV